MEIQGFGIEQVDVLAVDISLHHDGGSTMRTANAPEIRIGREARQIKTGDTMMSQHMPVNGRQRCAKQAVIRRKRQARSGKAANFLAALPKDRDDPRPLPDQDADMMTVANDPSSIDHGPGWAVLPGRRAR